LISLNEPIISNAESIAVSDDGITSTTSTNGGARIGSSTAGRIEQGNRRTARARASGGGVESTLEGVGVTGLGRDQGDEGENREQNEQDTGRHGSG